MDDTDINVIRLKIKGMTCESCQKKVRKALENVKGVKSAVVKHDEGFAEVHPAYDSPSREELIKAVESVGYDAELAE